MRTLILGGTGMLGHKLWQRLRADSTTWTTVRRTPHGHPLFDDPRVATGVDAREIESVQRVVDAVQPDVVINCIGIVKQVEAANDPAVALAVNAVFPHQLAKLCTTVGARLIHVSTDCVFSGREGQYAEGHPVDAEDLYGRGKALGEPRGEGCLVLRTSMVGRELGRRTHGLVEWFLTQSNSAVAYRRARFSGLTTNALADVVATLIVDHAHLAGLYHVAAAPISKLDLLAEIGRAFGRPIALAPVDEPVIDRTLDGRRFEVATGLTAPSWPEMVAAMAADPTPYEEWRARYDVHG